MMNFAKNTIRRIRDKKSCLLLGIDPNPQKLPQPIKDKMEALRASGLNENEVLAQGYEDFASAMIEGCAPKIIGIKPQLAYFEVLGSTGLEALERIIQKAKDLDLMVLMDAKRGDIGSTSDAYAQAFLGDAPLSGDAVTINPYLGTDGVEPFLTYARDKDKGVITLLRTSNPSSAEFQPLMIEALIQKFTDWNQTLPKSEEGWSGLGAVVGATHDEELTFLRGKLPHVWFLTPGLGAQGGSVEAVRATMKNGLGTLVPLSRAVLYASNQDDFVMAGVKELEKVRSQLMD